MATSLPKVVRMFGKSYAVELHPFDDRFGDHSQVELKVRVREDLPPDEERESLLHELCHAVDEQLGLGIREKRIRAFSVGLYAMLKDNPELVKYLMVKAKK